VSPNIYTDSNFLKPKQMQVKKNKVNHHLIYPFCVFPSNDVNYANLFKDKNMSKDKIKKAHVCEYEDCGKEFTKLCELSSHHRTHVKI